MKLKNLALSSKTLGKREAFLLSSLVTKGIKVFSVDEASKLTSLPKPKIYALIFFLKKKGWIKEIEKGKYALLSMSGLPTASLFSIATNIIWPSYVSFLSALNYYGFTEQVPRRIFVATTRRKKEITSDILSIHFIKLSPKRFFGYKKIEDFIISEKEKAIIDSLFLLKYVSLEEVAKCLYNARKEISVKKLVEYALRMKSHSLLKRLGYLLQILRIKASNKLIESLKKNLGKGYSLLDPYKEKKGYYDKEWKLIVNTSKEKLLYWRES